MSGTTLQMRSALTLCALASATAVHAAPALSIPPQPLGRALIALATQRGLNLSLSKAGSCLRIERGVMGDLSTHEALRRLLDGTGCAYRFIDRDAVEILPVAATTPRPQPSVATRPESVASLEELVVVATRRPTAAGRLAYPVSVVSGAELEAQGYGDDNALASATPAMIVTNLGQGRDKIVLRGLSDGPLTGRTQSMVGIYLDDVRLTYNAPDPDLKLVDVVQVEVLRGPQGALYGSGSLGGVLHVVTAAPDPGAYAASIATGGSVTDGGAPSNFLEGVVNIPAPWEGGAVRLVGYHELLGGYIDDP
ncbi:MAG: TonB-dependent receptor, partial [Proteobacteria bacterium]|nr:TonB-dependent receptor [Pseudomonadota bacterium]